MQLLPKKTNKKMETIRQSRDYTRLKKIKIFNIFLLIVVLTTLSTTFWFIYNYVYKTLNQIQDVALIKNIEKIETINFKIYEETITTWQNKNVALDILTPKRDLFNKTLFIPTSTPEITENTTTTTKTSTPN